MNGRPTVGPQNIVMRSSLEAKWAYFFEQLNWRWHYEPDFLKGYIPDFVLCFDSTEILVEVKGITAPWNSLIDCRNHLQRIRDAGWAGPCIVIGALIERTGMGALVGVGTRQDMQLEEVVIRYENTWVIGGNQLDYNWLSNTNYLISHSDSYDWVMYFWLRAQHLTRFIPVRPTLLTEQYVMLNAGTLDQLIGYAVNGKIDKLITQLAELRHVLHYR